jgi:hypothetical protein
MNIKLTPILASSALALSLNLQAASPGCPELSKPLAHHYSLDSVTGGTVTDSAGGNNGSNYGGTAVSGQLAGALAFSGGSYADLGEPSSSFSNGITVSLWVKPANFTVSDARYLSKATGSDADQHDVMLSAINNKGVRFRLRTGSNTKTLAHSQDTIILNQWNLVTGTYDNQVMKLYHNGSLLAQLSTSGNINMRSGVRTALAALNPSSQTKQFTGELDDVRIYDGALSGDEVNSLYNYRGEACQSAPLPPSGFRAI